MTLRERIREGWPDVACQFAGGASAVLRYVRPRVHYLLRGTTRKTVIGHELHLSLRESQVNDRSDAGGPVSRDDARALDELFSVTYEGCDASRRPFERVIQRDAQPDRAGQRGMARCASRRRRPHIARTFPSDRGARCGGARRSGATATGRQARRGALLVTFDESLHDAGTGADDLLALDHALDDLARIEPRQASLVECRFSVGSRSPSGSLARRVRVDRASRLARAVPVATELRRADDDGG